MQKVSNNDFNNLSQTYNFIWTLILLIKSYLQKIDQYAAHLRA